jgi:hypothetical protein
MDTFPFCLRQGDTLIVGSARVTVELVCDDGRVLLVIEARKGQRVVLEAVKLAEESQRETA